MIGVKKIFLIEVEINWELKVHGCLIKSIFGFCMYKQVLLSFISPIMFCSLFPLFFVYPGGRQERLDRRTVELTDPWICMSAIKIVDSKELLKDIG